MMHLLSGLNRSLLLKAAQDMVVGYTPELAKRATNTGCPKGAMAENHLGSKAAGKQPALYPTVGSVLSWALVLPLVG